MATPKCRGCGVPLKMLPVPGDDRAVYIDAHAHSESDCLALKLESAERATKDWADRFALAIKDRGELSSKLSWRSIETAPLDGTEVLLIATVGSMLAPNPERIVGRWERGWWGESPLSHVTHWMPLPEPPQ
jgi:hypothetical protein